MNGKDIKNQSEGGQEADNTASETDQAAVTRGEVKGVIESSEAESRPNTPSLKEKLTSDLAGIAEVSTPEWLPEKLGGYEMLAIDIKDKAAMLTPEGVRRFLPHIGKLHYDTFLERERESDWNLEDPDFVERALEDCFVGYDISYAEKMYLIVENGRVLGLYYLKYREAENGKRYAHVLLTTLDKPCRGTLANEHLSRTVFENEKVDAFTAFTHTPQLVKSWIRIGTMTDMNVYFCGRKNGDKNEPITEREKTKADEALQYDLKVHIREYDAEVPGHPHYANYGKESIPPRKLSEVRLSPDDPVYRTLEELISFQGEEYPDDCIYGTMMMVCK